MSTVAAAVASALSRSCGNAFGNPWAGGDGLSFDLPLYNTIVPSKGQGSATFTRASTATVDDHEGCIQSCLSGEARFSGARRVFNMLSGPTNTPTNNAGGWFNSNAGTLFEGTLTGTAVAGSGAGVSVSASYPAVSGRTYIFSFDAQYVSGNSDWILYSTGAAAFAFMNTINITTMRRRHYVTLTCTGSGTITLKIGRPSSPSGTATMLLSNVQLEDVTGGSRLAPSEYVSVGALSAPFHGAGVDGVKYFSTWNRHTVLAGGYVVEPGREAEKNPDPLIQNPDGWQVLVTGAGASTLTASVGKLSYYSTGVNNYLEASIENTELAWDALTQDDLYEMEFDVENWTVVDYTGNPQLMVTAWFGYNGGYAATLYGNGTYRVIGKVDNSSSTSENNCMFLTHTAANITGSIAFDVTRISLKRVTSANPLLGQTFGRRAENLLPQTYDLVHSNDYSVQSGATMARSSEAPPLTNEAVALITPTGASSQWKTSFSIPGLAGRTVVYSVYVKGTQANQTLALSMYDGTGSVTQNVTVGTSWTRVSMTRTHTEASTHCYVYVRPDVVTGTAPIYISAPMVEDVTGRANQNPSEYVSKGRISFPFHGTGLPGVKEFSTTNPNTVSGNIVNPNGAVTYPVTPCNGALLEEARTNRCPQSSNLTSWWYTSRCAAPTAATISNPFPHTFYRLQSNDASVGQHRIATPPSFAGGAATVTISWYVIPGEIQNIFFVEALSAAGERYSSMSLLGIGGAITSATGHTVRVTKVPGAFALYRCSVTITDCSGSAGLIGIGLTNSGGAHSVSITSGQGIWLSGVQVEDGAFASSYIPTAGLDVARVRDKLSYPDTGNLSNVSGTAFATTRASFPNNPPGGEYRRIISTSSNAAGGPALMLTNGALDLTYGIFDSNLPVARSGTVAAFNTRHKVATKWGASAMRAIVDGNAFNGVEQTYDGTIMDGAILIGGSARDAETYCGTVKDVKIFKKQFSDSKMQRLTL